MRLYWHRRDLRPGDNRGVVSAADDGPVVPVFVLDPVILEYGAPPRVAAMLDALGALREWYRTRGSDLLVVRGDPEAVLVELARAFDADGVTFAADYSGLAGERDRAVTASLEDEGFDATAVSDALLFEPGTISPNEGEHYSVFSYFWEKWRDREKADPIGPPGREQLASGDDWWQKRPSGDDEGQERPTVDDEGQERPSVDVDGREATAVADLNEDPLPTLGELGFEDPAADLPPVTSEAATDRLEAFCAEDIYHYEAARDDPAADCTSRLSVHFKWGTLGAREAFAATERAAERATSDDDRSSVAAFQRQLAWREFYAHVLSYNPETVSADFVAYANPIEWRSDPDALAAWKAGETGYPIVDAGMRQLSEEAWMHNRVRMIVASFLTKDLLLDWREGYEWFRERLADHDTANDVGGWQWAASTGTDAQPYFRIFNPMTQGERHDPDAEYVREHVPELRSVEPRDVHRWNELDDERRRDLAPAYPVPVVDHAAARERALETFERARGD